ncbi:hypothetical protein ACFVHW_34495, partial [Streptomyces sp. NPDC127110]|uniref:hypothetical protein n=1 Tax=Streptomyces sp. NPDC127110 TaxID=3345362 RepID=UPI00364142C9
MLEERPYASLSAVEIAGLVNRGRVSARDVVDTALASAPEHDGAQRAVTPRGAGAPPRPAAAGGAGGGPGGAGAAG